jgi:hypothetical protein
MMLWTMLLKKEKKNMFEKLKNQTYPPPGGKIK